MKYTRFLTRTVIIALLYTFTQNTQLAHSYTTAENCEIGITAARLPLIMASKVSAISNNPRCALIFQLITHAARTTAEMLHINNRPFDLRHHSYACITYDVAHFLTTAKKLYDLEKTAKQSIEENAEKKGPKRQDETKKSLMVLRDIVLPVVESGTALYRALVTTDNMKYCKYRLTMDDIGAFARSFENLIEDDKSTPEQIIAIAYILYTTYFLLQDFVTPPQQAIRIPHHEIAPGARPAEAQATRHDAAHPAVNGPAPAPRAIAADGDRHVALPIAGDAPAPRPAEDGAQRPVQGGAVPEALPIPLAPEARAWDPLDVERDLHDLDPLTPEEMAAAERAFGGWDYPRPGGAAGARGIAAPVISVAPDAVINDQCPLSQEPFVNGQNVLRLSCGHGIVGTGELYEGFRGTYDICPLCRAGRNEAAERIIIFHPAAPAAAQAPRT